MTKEFFKTEIENLKSERETLSSIFNDKNIIPLNKEEISEKISEIDNEIDSMYLLMKQTQLLLSRN